MRLGSQALALVALTALAVGIALLLGATDLGIALGVGQILFVIGLVYLLLRA